LKLAKKSCISSANSDQKPFDWNSDGMQLTRSSAKIVRSSAQIESSSIAKVDESIDHFVEVAGRRNVSRIDPFDGGRVAEVVNGNVNAGRVRGRSIVRIVRESNVVQEAGQNKRDNLFQVQPQVEIVFGLLGAKVSNDFRLVELGVQL
jgi:hypothetical protein